MIVINPTLNEEEVNKIIDKITNLITGNSGELIKVEKMGVKKLAYEIKKNKNGNYVLIEFKSPPSFISELIQTFRVTDSIIRYSVMKKDAKL
jgi:small subunit ribosomal protein S6